MKKRLAALILAAAMLISCLAACGGNDESASVSGETSSQQQSSSEASAPEDDGTRDINGLTLPITPEKTEISVLMVYDSNVIEDPNDIAGVKAMEEATNVHVNWTVYSQTVMLEKFSQMMATGELFDVMFPGGTNSYSGGYQQGIEDGVLIDMDPYIKEYMPNYMALLESNSKAKKQATSDDGLMHSVRVLRGTDENLKIPGAFLGPAIRADLLEKMGEDVPETVDQLHDLLVKCKEAGMTAPMTLQGDGGTSLSLAWGVNTDWSTNFWQYDEETQKVCYAPFSENWDVYLDTMRDWYAEGLIDKNFTIGSPVISGDYSNYENDQCMFIDTWFNFLTGDEIYRQGFVSNDKVNIVPLTGIVLNPGDPTIWCGNESYVNQEIYVTTEAEDKIDVVSKWIDYHYTTEGMRYKYYGIEGESYTLDSSGEVTYTDAILNDPDGLSIGDALSKYAMRTYFGYQSETAENSTAIASAAGGSVPVIEASEVWSSADITVHVPPVTLSQEENEYINTYITDIQTMLQERMTKYILGTDTTSHEEFREKLKASHIEECTARMQAAVDRYNAR